MHNYDEEFEEEDVGEKAIIEKKDTKEQKQEKPKKLVNILKTLYLRGKGHPMGAIIYRTNCWTFSDSV